MTAKQPNSREHASTAVPVQPGFFSAQSVPRILPFGAYIAFIAIADLLHRFGATAEQLLWLYPVKVLVVTALLVVYWGHYTELRAPRLSVGQWMASILAGVVVFVLWISLNASWMRIGSVAGFNPAGADGMNWTLVAFRLAGAALVVPVMEELFWRSFLQRWLEKADFLNCAPAAVGIRALAITALLFGFEHDLWFAGIVAGLFYGLLYVKAGNLWAPIIAHSVTNGVLGFWVLATGSWTYW